MWVYARLPSHVLSLHVKVHGSLHMLETKRVCVSVHLCTPRHVWSHKVCDCVTHIVTSKHRCLVARADRFNKAELQIASCISFPSLSPLFFFKSFVFISPLFPLLSLSLFLLCLRDCVFFILPISPLPLCISSLFISYHGMLLSHFLLIISLVSLCAFVLVCSPSPYLCLSLY